MGRSIIKQPNGKFAVFSSIVDDFVFTDATQEELIAFYIEGAKRDVEREIARQLKLINEYQIQNTQVLIESLEAIKSNHGNERLQEALKAIELKEMPKLPETREVVEIREK